MDIVLDLSGLEVEDIQQAVGLTPLVDVSASSAHLGRLSASVPHGGSVLLGAGIAPGASTVLVRALDPQPGDEIDVAVMLGAGESHGAAALRWTAGLVGAPLYAAPEAHAILNFRSSRRLSTATGSTRTHLRADFPDDFLVGRPSGVEVRSWLALDSRTATLALRLLGTAPSLAPLLNRAPHIGGERWSVTAVHRRTGRKLGVSGIGQSVATGRLAALAAERIVLTNVRGALTMDAVLHPRDLELAGGIRLHAGTHSGR
ncbi:hypothetical protein [Microbacterium nymphoidis]|uniref:hypothetical protein n=1 Tax=Microbacterium nymphoidis TaxID=2898586 RepID=UPI001E297FE3|nr:hypothetical protein [Microbacterium nymphoidis]MCD2498485.1 hypothetical protein [Microbacterium nymphoidis]